MSKKIEDTRILEINEVISPQEVHGEYPLPKKTADSICATRQAIHDVLSGEDDRLIVIVGPCSIHDPKAAKEYAARLNIVKNELQDELLIVMRVYFEKPRTTVGWKGLINDPNLDNSFEINKGLKISRELLIDINNIGVPAATEFLDLITPQYIADLISWGAIGARTTESQLHRELASGLSCPVGFKNGTDGTLKVAIDAVRAARRPHHFLSLTMQGRSAIFSTSGNGDSHIILRGGREPNYTAKHVHQAAQELSSAGLEPRVMVDLSHANSRKQYQRQLEVGDDVAQQIADGDTQIMGIMVESHLNAGRQDKPEDGNLVYGQSITDGCIGWEQTGPLLVKFAEAVKSRRC